MWASRHADAAYRSREEEPMPRPTGRPPGLSITLATLLVVVAACGASARGVPANAGGASAPAKAGGAPSKAAQMVCGAEGQKDIAEALGATTTAPVTPTWADHLYSCTYTYADGRIALSVKELNDAASTTAYFASVESNFGHGTDVAGVGQGAFQGDTGSVVVRKDFKVLDVDVNALPDHFGSPPIDRGEAAMRVAVTVMGCWTDN
ncbi:MAG TPA: hypothetical protein VFA84_12360 [Acidimicrobiales bacterium]|nr:hypothetical protein [Acidimicrobiales bacterium]